MISSPTVLRTLVIYGLVLPCALVLGYLLATPLDPMSFGTVVLVLSAMLIPVLMRWHHALLFFSWNMTAVVFFLPGHPNLWLLTTGLSLVFSIVQRALSKEMRFLPATSIALPLLTLLAVVLFTAYETGGMGLRVLGSGSVGGRRYVLIFGAILGFFAMAAQQIPAGKGNSYLGLYQLGLITAAAGMLLPYLRPEFYFVFWLFPIQDLTNVTSVTNDVVEAVPEIERFYGMSEAGLAVCFFMLARYGVRGLLDLKKPFRLAIFVAASVISLYGGHRSFLVLFGITFVLAFIFEGLLRTRLLWILLTSAILTMAVIIPMADKLPLPIQRSLSILPFVEVSPVARFDARGSSDWRLAMWRLLWPEVPHYLVVGKGLQINSLDLDLVNELVKRGLADTAEVSMLAGDYHNGPLSVLIPFGMGGALAFVWFLVAGARALWLNYKYGLPEHRTTNGFLLALFIARIVLFMFVFGGFYGDLAHFTGIIGFSISLNGGIRHRAIQPVPEPVEEQAQPLGGLATVS